MMIRRNRAFWMKIVLFCTVFFFAGKVLERLFDDRIPGDPFFVYRAYLDERGEVPKLRVLAFNQCHRDRPLRAVLANRAEFSLTPVPIYHSCPEAFSPSCLLVAHFHEADVDAAFPREKIVIKGPSVTATLPLHIATPAKKRGMAICLAPMFWYTDWTKLIFFIEYWKKQEVEEIMIYVHSATDYVYKVLNYYQENRWLTIIPWSSLPRVSDVEPNNYVYRLGQVFAHNDCILRNQYQYTILLDIDEFIFTNEPLKDYVVKQFQEENMGSLSFPHYVALFQPPLMPKPFSFERVDYRGVRNLIHKADPTRNPKVIARTDAINLMAIHEVIAFRNNEIDIVAMDAILFHVRYNYDADHSKMQMTTLGPDVLKLQHDLNNATHVIFPHGAFFKEETQTELGNCLQEWRSSPTKCKAPLTHCRSVVAEKEIWIENTQNIYYVL